MALISIAYAGEGRVPDFLMNSELNAVPRMGRRSLNPFQRDQGAFRFAARPRRFWSGYPGMGFRFNSGSGDDDIIRRHKRVGEMEPASDKPGVDSAALIRQSKRNPLPHPLPRPFGTIKSDQRFWEDVISEAARDSILQKLVRLTWQP